MTQLRDDVAGLEAIHHHASADLGGQRPHFSTFSDLMVDCLLTKKRFRADQVEPQSGIVYFYTGAKDGVSGKESQDAFSVLVPARQAAGKRAENSATFLSNSAACRIPTLHGRTFRADRRIRSAIIPKTAACSTEPRPFNLMLKTYVGPVESEDNMAYLRPETAQAIFAQFKNVLEVSRQKVPFGICQIGKAFRNEINPRNFTFRSREFEQMELEFFIRPDEAVEAIYGKVAQPAGPGHPGEPQPNWGWQIWHQYWVEERFRFYENIGLPRHSLVEYWQKPDELAHYARATVDILYKFPFSKRDEKGELMGEELEGVAARSDFDLSPAPALLGQGHDGVRRGTENRLAEADAAKSKLLCAALLQRRGGIILLKRERPAEKAEKQAPRRSRSAGQGLLRSACD